MIQGQCEMCSLYVDDLYDASAIAEMFGLSPAYDNADRYMICGECLNVLEEKVKSAWANKVA